MKYSILFWSASVFLLNLALTHLLSAQSTVIRLPGEINVTPNDSGQMPGISDFPISTMSPAQKRWESILNQPHPEIPAGTFQLRDLLNRLRRIGLPILLDDSATVDLLPEDELIELTLIEGSLGTRLRHAFRIDNGVLAMVDRRLMLISLDVEDDPDYFMTVSYDVSQLPTSLQAVVDNIQTNIDSDGWDTTNGDSTITISIVNGRQLLNLSAPYYVHVSVKRLLRGWLKLSGAPFSNQVASTNGNLGARPVMLPGDSEYMRPRLGWSNRPGGRGRGGGGFGGGGRGGGAGGFGGGGGVF